MDVRKTADEKIRKIHIDGDGWRKEALAIEVWVER